jgi:hypothetical protein
MMFESVFELSLHVLLFCPSGPLSPFCFIKVIASNRLTPFEIDKLNYMFLSLFKLKAVLHIRIWILTQVVYDQK